jgi:nitroreductase
MMPDHTVAQIIASRRSVRSYQPTPLESELLRSIVTGGEQSTPLFPEIALRFILILDGPAFIREHGGVMRHYGRILGAPHYLAAVSETRAGYMINTGFRMEPLILHATAQGIGTCWLGGGYRRQDVGEILDISPDEQVVALTPLGWPAAGMRAAMSRTIKLFTPGQGKRLPLNQIVFAETWGNAIADELSGRPALGEMLEAARLAPSWVNSQPWRFVVREERVIVAVARPAGQNELPYYLLDGGIAMSHIHLIASELGQTPAWETDPDHLKALHAGCGAPAEYDVIGAWRPVD